MLHRVKHLKPGKNHPSSGHNTRQPKIAAINDLTGFGRCSLAVSLPIISAMGLQCCPMPTAVLSNHTGFDSFSFLDTTDEMPQFTSQWEKLGLNFAGIYSGFLGSCKQAEVVLDFLDQFHHETCLYLCDPVMGDNGIAYATCNPSLQEEMRRLVECADVITPNLTEACMLTDTPYHTDFSLSELQQLAVRLGEDRKMVVITGIEAEELLLNCALNGATGAYDVIASKKEFGGYSGTGDVFASVLAASLVKQTDFFDGVKKAAKFTERAVALSHKARVPLTDGVCFEPLLGRL